MILHALIGHDPAMAAAAAVCGLLLSFSAARAAEPPATPLTVVLIGDSTVASYTDRPDLAGWGQVMPEFFTDHVRIVNLASSGRSSKSFIKEGRWDHALDGKVDYVFIQFGHNDCPGKADRSTDPSPTGDFRQYIRRYVGDAQERGVKPILVTPMARRTFTHDGHAMVDTLRPYADAMIAVGKELNVPVIDLHRKSTALFLKLGDQGSADLSCGPNDRTHFSPKGARAMVRLILEDLPEDAPQLAAFLKPQPSD